MSVWNYLRVAFPIIRRFYHLEVQKIVFFLYQIHWQNLLVHNRWHDLQVLNRNCLMLVHVVCVSHVTRRDEFDLQYIKSLLLTTHSVLFCFNITYVQSNASESIFRINHIKWVVQILLKGLKLLCATLYCGSSAFSLPGPADIGV